MTENNGNPNNPHDGHPRNPEEDRFRDGFIDGFTRAREIFWRDLMRKAGECRLMSEVTTNQSFKDNLAAMEAVYRFSADLISRSHTLYPGAIPRDIDADDPRFNVKFDENLFRY